MAVERESGGGDTALTTGNGGDPRSVDSGRRRGLGWSAID